MNYKMQSIKKNLRQILFPIPSKALLKKHFKYILLPLLIWLIIALATFNLLYQFTQFQNWLGALIFTAVWLFGPVIFVIGIVKSGTYKKGVPGSWWMKIMLLSGILMFLFGVFVFIKFGLALIKSMQ